MFSIGEFARHGRVPVRMLRYYDAIGLLRPASVDPDSGYRFYQASQLAELNRIIALKNLGFTLQQVLAILAEQVSAAELRGILKLRRAEIFDRIKAETVRLARVEARLLSIEDEARVPVDGVVIKRLVPVRVGELTGTAAGYEPEAITPVIQPLYCELWQLLASAGVSAAGPAIAYYEDTPSGDGQIVVHAAVPVVAEPGSDHGFRVVDLTEVGSAAAIIHHGSMNDVLSTCLPAATPRSRTGSPQRARGVTKALLDWAAGQGLTWDMSPSGDGDRWGGRLEFYLTDPARSRT